MMYLPSAKVQAMRDELEDDFRTIYGKKNEKEKAAYINSGEEGRRPVMA
jgi:hypothetical protein